MCGLLFYINMRHERWYLQHQAVPAEDHSRAAVLTDHFALKTKLSLSLSSNLGSSSKIIKSGKADGSIRDKSKSFWMTHFWKLVEIQFVFWQSPISQSMSDLDRVERTKAKLFYSSNCKISFASWKMPQRMRHRLGYISNWCRWIFRFGSGWDEGHCPLASI